MSWDSGAPAMDQLRGVYSNRYAAALEAHRAGTSVVGVTSATVPCELIAAAGMFPLLLSSDEVDPQRPAAGLHRSPQTLPHEIFMEDAFDTRTRALFDFLISGRGEFLKAVIVPRTSDREHKLFLYLKEVQRQQNLKGVPDVFLYNLLQTRSAEAREYSSRTHARVEVLFGVVGRSGNLQSHSAQVDTNGKHVAQPLEE